MKKIFKTLPLALIVISLYSCTSDDETVQEAKDNSSVVTTFTCTQENDGTATKAALDSDSKTILWKTGDAISIFGNDNKNKKYDLDSGSNGKSTGTFSGTGAVTSPYVAVYPYTKGAKLNGNEVTGVTLPDEQNAVAGGFDPNAALMIAKSTTTSLQFRNAVGFIKVQLAEGFNCKKIILRAADKTTPLAGKGTLKFDASGYPYIDFDGSSELSYSITLSGTITGGKAYYIAVPAGEYSAKWTLTFVTENKNYMRQVNKSITFVRNKAWNLGTFATDGDYWVTGSSGIVDPTSQEVNMGVFTIGEKQYNVIFAKSNLTATGLAANESEFGDYFAWAATEPWLTSYTYDGSGTNDASFGDKTWKTGYKAGYAWLTVPYRDGTNNFCSKYKNKYDVLVASDDAANVILGGDWQIPTQAIWQALVNNSTQKNRIEDRKGYEFENNNQTLFLPASGYVDGTSFEEVGSDGYSLSGTARSSTHAFCLNFYSVGVYAENNYYRYRGFSVRPVRLVAE